MKTLRVVALALWGAAANSGHATEFITSIGGGNTLFGDSIGYRFTVGSLPLNVTAFGIIDNRALASPSVEIDLWTEGGQLLAYTVFPAGTMINPWQPPSVPVTLAPNTTYRISAFASGGDYYRSVQLPNPNTTFAPHAMYDGLCRSNNDNNPAFPGGFFGPSQLVAGANFRYDVGQPMPLQLMTAVSRKIHGAAGIFDVNLPFTGQPGVECRNGGGDHTMVFTFNNDVVSGDASVTSGLGSVAGQPSFAGHTMTVEVTGVANVQMIAVTVSNVMDSFGQALPDTTANMNMLTGDAGGNKIVNASDIAQAKAQLGNPVTGSNFRTDVNVNGTITASDVAQVKAHLGTGLP